MSGIDKSTFLCYNFKTKTSMLNEMGVIMIYEKEKKQDTLELLEEIYFDETQDRMPQLPLSGKLAGVVSHKDFYKKYIEPDMASSAFDKSVETLRTNPEALSMLLDINDATQYTFENSLLGLINQYTSESNPTMLALIISALKNHSNVKNIECSQKGLSIVLNDNTVINVQNLSQTFGLNNENDTIFNRLANSQKMSLVLARNIPNAKVVTGKIAGQTSKSSYLHTWVETTAKDGQKVVFDYSMNAIINKDGFYNLRHASQVSSINGAEISSDLEKVYPIILAGELSGKEYLVCRDLIIEALSESEK